MLVKNEESAWQKASASLDATAKIYGFRVDSVHSETFKFLGGLNRNKKDLNLKDDNNNNNNNNNEENPVEEVEQTKKKEKLKRGIKLFEQSMILHYHIKIIFLNLKINISVLLIIYHKDVCFLHTFLGL